MEHETISFDVVIVGAGPAGLATAIHLKQLDPSQSVCVLEKSAEIGGHILSGAVFETPVLAELIPDWQNKGAPLNTAVTEDRFLWLTQRNAYPLPRPPMLHNAGNHIISLGHLCRWLAKQAETLGVDIYTGFSATECITNADHHVIGILTGAMGIQANGTHGPHYQPGIILEAKQFVLAEGCRGSLTEKIIRQYDLRQNPQSYGLGLKEVWKISQKNHRPGQIWHTLGWPLDRRTYGGGFLYHWGKIVFPSVSS